MAGKHDIAELGRQYWLTHIPWGTKGATRECHTQLMAHAHFTSEQAWGYCAERHHDATGKWPGGHKGKRDGLAPSQAHGAHIFDGSLAVTADVDVLAAFAARRSATAERTVAFEFRDVADGGDGLTFSGYAAVFGSPTTIRDAYGEFTETVAPGAFRSSLEARTPVLMFDHGKHPLIGQMPLGRITEAREDDHGLWIEARLSDNWLIEPVRDAVRDRAVEGMSFRFTTPPNGDAWNQDKTERTLTSVNCSELGPVVFPAYTPTTASIRSLAEHLPDLTGQSRTQSAGGGDPREAGQGGAHPSTEAQARHRDLLMKGIIRA